MSGRLSGRTGSYLTKGGACAQGSRRESLLISRRTRRYSRSSALAFQALKILGVVYLLYMAWNTLRAEGPLRVSSNEDVRSGRQVIGSAILVNVLNAKLSIFFLAFLPQFVHSGEPDAVTRMVVLSLVFMLMTFVIFVGYGLFAAAVRIQVSTRGRETIWVRRTFAGAFVVLSARLALAER